MCNFCERILDDKKVGWIDNNVIAYDQKFNQFNIQGILQDVKFCPYCGEKLQFRKEGGLMKQDIINCLIKYATHVAETVQYKNWSDEFCRKEIQTATMDFLSTIRKHIDFSKLTREEAYSLGFGRWSAENDLYLIPLYLLPIIPIGIELTCIDGQKIIYDGTNVDNDVRFGYIAWGIEIPKRRKLQ